MPADHPDVWPTGGIAAPIAGPTSCPGFREMVIVDYCDTMEALVKKLVRVHARASTCRRPISTATVRRTAVLAAMTHHPHQDGPVEDEFGLAPHTDTSFHPARPKRRPGLHPHPGRHPDRCAGDPDAYVVNGGQFLQRWTNDSSWRRRTAPSTGAAVSATPFHSSATAISTGLSLPCRPPSAPTSRPATRPPVHRPHGLVSKRNHDESADRRPE